ncbi:hypothetical protein C0992_006045 [Termitomyces sp. T32_za158]|nr:hypothetical protein C0992_006045 [Termitomyces sp. T32_za158]
MDSDANRRPKVYKDILVKFGWEVLNKSDAATYLPTDVVTTEEGNLKPPPPVTCLLGPFGEQTETKIEMLQSHKMATERGSKGKEPDLGEMKCEMVLCVEGGPAHELKWCPLPSHDDFSVNRRPRKLGLLSGIFEDGSLSIYVVPYPTDVAPEDGASQPVYG